MEGSAFPSRPSRETGPENIGTRCVVPLYTLLRSQIEKYYASHFSLHLPKVLKQVHMFSQGEGEEGESTVRKSRRCVSVSSGSRILRPARIPERNSSGKHIPAMSEKIMLIE
jgi:hypothetical protein